MDRIRRFLIGEFRPLMEEMKVGIQEQAGHGWRLAPRPGLRRSSWSGRNASPRPATLINRGAKPRAHL